MRIGHGNHHTKYFRQLSLLASEFSSLPQCNKRTDELFDEAYGQKNCGTYRGIE